MTEHTKEPWLVYSRPEEYVIANNEVDDDYRVIALMRPRHSNEIANAARIVACVNACAGLNPEAVPASVSIVRSIHSILERYFEGNINGWDDQEILHSLKDYLGDMKAALELAEKEE